MTYEKISILLACSPAVNILRARNAPLILSFLFREFKKKNRLIVSNQELIIRLSDYLEALDYSDEDHKNKHQRDSAIYDLTMDKYFQKKDAYRDNAS